MSGLLIQHARWQKALVTPDDKRLEAGAKCGCVCIVCDKPLILRRGEKRRWHFAHRAETSCGGETYIHNVVKTWIAEELPGQSIPLPPHPALSSPYRYMLFANNDLLSSKNKDKTDKNKDKTDKNKDKTDKNKDKTDKNKDKTDKNKDKTDKNKDKTDKNKDKTEFSEGNRRYDVCLEGMPVYNWGRGDIKQDLGFRQYLMWSHKQTRTRVLQDSRLGEYLKWVRQDPLLKALKVADYMEPRNYVHPAITKFMNEISCHKGESALSSDKLGHLIFEVYYSNAKDDDFKLQVQEERRYVLEVNAKKFYGDGTNLTVERLIKNSHWVWFTDEQKN